MERISKDILTNPTWEDFVQTLGGQTPGVKRVQEGDAELSFETQTFEGTTADDAKAQYADKIVGQRGVVMVDPGNKTVALHERVKEELKPPARGIAKLWAWAFRKKTQRITSGASIMLGGSPTKTAQDILGAKVNTKQSFDIEADVLHGANDLKGKRYAFMIDLAKSTKEMVGKALKSKTGDQISVVSFEEARTKLLEAKRELELKVLDEVEKVLA